LRQAGQRLATGVSQTASQLRDYSQQAASQVKDTGSNLGDLAQQATQRTTTEVKQTGQDTINSIR
jgi:hypothetical protein